MSKTYRKNGNGKEQLVKILLQKSVLSSEPGKNKGKFTNLPQHDTGDNRCAYLVPENKPGTCSEN